MRPSWDDYFMGMARHVATRSTCLRGSVGAVIVRDRRILTCGYNGSLQGQPHCSEVGCLLVGGGCVRTIHAEKNAICQAARDGIPLSGSTLYVTVSPCLWCFKDLIAAGIKEVVYDAEYREALGRQFANSANVEIRRFGADESKSAKLTGSPDACVSETAALALELDPGEGLGVEA